MDIQNRYYPSLFINQQEFIIIFKSLFQNYEHFQDVKTSSQQFQNDFYQNILKQILNDNIQNGLNNLKNILNRSSKKVSLSVEAMYLFLSHYLNKTNNKEICFDILRFIGQLSDSNRKKQQSQTVTKLLKNIGMDEHEAISEIRHALTHKLLPDQFIIQKSLEYIIIFIFEKYWLKHFKQIQKQYKFDKEKFDYFKTKDMKFFSDCLEYQIENSLDNVLVQEKILQYVQIIKNEDIKLQKQALIINKITLKFIHIHSKIYELQQLDNYNKILINKNREFIKNIFQKIIFAFLSKRKNLQIREFLEKFQFLQSGFIQIYLFTVDQQIIKLFEDAKFGNQIQQFKNIDLNIQNQQEDDEVENQFQKFKKIKIEQQQICGENYLKTLQLII